MLALRYQLKLKKSIHLTTTGIEISYNHYVIQDTYTEKYVGMPIILHNDTSRDNVNLHLRDMRKKQTFLNKIHLEYINEILEYCEKTI